ncbi:MAG: hypothetical protein HKN73_06045 [Gemmatimonadetes bacterium]|nr:hypothetical protein [Gemmatimonadota bacterium]
MRAIRGRLWLAVLAGVLPASSASAQSGEVRLDFGAARTLPPAGTDAVEASYLLLGLSGQRTWAGGSLVGFSLAGGRPAGTLGSDWASGQVMGELWTDRGGLFDLGLGARGYAFRVGAPFVYETNTVELMPQVRVNGSRMSSILRGEVGSGRSEIALHRTDFVRRGSRELWHRGIVLENSVLVPRGLVVAGGGLYEGRAGSYKRGFLEWILSGPATVRVSGEAWDTPLGVVYAGSVGLSLSLWGPWTVRADGGRGLPDPLVRAPQGLQGGGFLGLRLLDLAPGPIGSTSVRVLEEDPAGAMVAFSLPENVGDSVWVRGSFTAWEGRAMRVEDGQWRLRLRVPPGTHHFGFEVDGDWYLPPDVPGRVADEWGQENGTLVVSSDDNVTGGTP